MGEFTSLGENAHGPAAVGGPFFDWFEVSDDDVLASFLDFLDYQRTCRSIRPAGSPGLKMAVMT
jgi:hypothetical protein